MKQLLRGIRLSDLLVDGPFTLMWIVMAAGDLVHGWDWPSALLHFWTGVIVGAFVLRVQLSYRRMHAAQADYRRAVEALKAERPALDIDQMRQHLMN